jgi:small subunit ribosomal protein S1
VVTATITKLATFGAFAKIDDSIEGLIHISELADYRINHPKEVVQEGDEVQVRVIRIDPQRRRIGLSLRQASEEAYVEMDWQEDAQNVSAASSWPNRAAETTPRIRPHSSRATPGGARALRQNRRE